MRARLLLLVVPLLSCTGQSGTEPQCPDPTHCMCRFDRTAIAPLRATVVSTEEGGLVAMVTEVPDGTYDLDIVAGVEVGGDIEGCMTPPAIGAGDQVLLYYARGNQDGLGCPEYLACTDSDCAGLEPVDGPTYEQQAAQYDECLMACQAQHAEQCATRGEQARLAGHMQIAVLRDAAWSFGTDAAGTEARLSEDDLDILSDPETCQARFPRSTTPCNDVIINGSGDETPTEPPPED